MRAWLINHLKDEEDTVCDVAAREGVFCRGFDRFPTPILRKSFPWLAHDPEISREDLVDRIRRWINARKFVLSLPSACDVEACEKDMCMGFEGFDDEKIAASYQEMFGESVEILPFRPAAD